MRYVRATSLAHIPKTFFCCYHKQGSIELRTCVMLSRKLFLSTSRCSCQSHVPAVTNTAQQTTQVDILLKDPIKFIPLSSAVAQFRACLPACLRRSVGFCLNAPSARFSHCVRPGWAEFSSPCTLLDIGTFPLSFGLNKYVLWTPSQNALARIHAYSQSALLLDTSPEDSRGAARMAAPVYLLHGQDANTGS